MLHIDMAIKQSIAKIENDISWIKDFFRQHIRLQEEQGKQFETWKKEIENKIHSCP